VAAWLGLESSGGRLLEGTLWARFSLLLTVILSIAAVGLFMGHTALVKVGYEWYDFWFDWSIFWISDISWAALFVLALGNAFMVGLEYIRRTAYFIYLSSRWQGSELAEYGY
jgi:hypothetical protein